MKVRLLIAAAVMAVAGCISIEQLAPSVDEAFIADAGGSVKNEEVLRRGRHLYTARCGTCHSLDAADDFSMAEWKEIMYEEDMAEKSKFSEAETQAVLSYLETAKKVLSTRSKRAH